MVRWLHTDCRGIYTYSTDGVCVDVTRRTLSRKGSCGVSVEVTRPLRTYHEYCVKTVVRWLHTDCRGIYTYSTDGVCVDVTRWTLSRKGSCGVSVEVTRPLRTYHEYCVKTVVRWLHTDCRGIYTYSTDGVCVDVTRWTLSRKETCGVSVEVTRPLRTYHEYCVRTVVRWLHTDCRGIYTYSTDGGCVDVTRWTLSRKETCGVSVEVTRPLRTYHEYCVKTVVRWLHTDCRGIYTYSTDGGCVDVTRWTLSRKETCGVSVEVTRPLRTYHEYCVRTVVRTEGSIRLHTDCRGIYTYSTDGGCVDVTRWTLSRKETCGVSVEVTRPLRTYHEYCVRTVFRWLHTDCRGIYTYSTGWSGVWM